MKTWNQLTHVVWVTATYICLILPMTTSGESATAGVYFVRSPKPIVAPPGDRVVFECATNVPPERVVWLHNQIEYSSGNVSLSRSGSRRPGRHLTEISQQEVLWPKEITKIKREDTFELSKSSVHLILRISKNPMRYQQQAGDYQCVAWFGAVALTSLPARLSIAKLGDFPQIISGHWIQHLNVSDFHSDPVRPAAETEKKYEDVSKTDIYSIDPFVGETIILPCPPPPSDPPATISFYKSGTRVIENDRIKVLPSGNLLVINCNQADNGQYTCTASNHITTEEIGSKRIFKVAVRTQPKNTKATTLLWHPDESYTSEIGQNVTLECAASGWPRPSVRWSREGNLTLPFERSLNLGGTLLISKLVAQDEGYYICEASNGIDPIIRATTLLRLNEPITVIKPPKDTRVEEGGSVSLDCLARGKPSPMHSWFFNGRVLANDSHVTILGDRLTVNNATKKHAGIFQCFVTNTLKKVEGRAATLEVVPRPQVATFHGDDDDDDDDDDENDEDSDSEDLYKMITTSLPTKTINSKIKSSGNVIGNKGRKGKHRSREMIPPSRPNITRLTDESVMVHWSVPLNEGLPIEFFKVQYKEADKRGSRWRTIDEDIPSHIRSYEVTGLKASQTYRFRIAAVYSNNDNKLGPNSGKFVLEKEPPKRKPAFSPLIDTAEAVSQSAIMIQWKYSDLEAIPLEGFFIYYRSTTSAGDYTKVTVLGSNTRSHIVTHLLPETYYDLKMQAFSLTGTSEFSRIVTAKTLGFAPSPSSTYRSHNGIGNNNHRESVKHMDTLDIVSSDTSVTNDTIYVILGSVLGGLTVLVVLLVAFYHCRQRTTANQSNHSRTVWNDIDNLSTKQISETNNMLGGSNHRSFQHKKLTNGHLSSFVGHSDPLYVDCVQQLVKKNSDDMVETSFCNEGRYQKDHQPPSLNCDSQRGSENLNRSYKRNVSPCRLLPQSPKLMETNTSPLLRHNGMRDPCLEDAEWESSVPAADSEKFI